VELYLKDKMENYLQCFKTVYFSELYGTEEGNKILNTKMSVLDLDENECRIKEKMLIEKYQRYSNLLEEFEAKINSGNKIIINELEQIKSDLGLTETEIFRLKINNKLNAIKMPKRENYVIYFSKHQDDKLELYGVTREELRNRLSKGNIEGPYRVYKGNEEVRAFKLTNNQEEIVFQVELVTLSDIKKIKFTYEGNLYCYCSPIISNEDIDCFSGTFIDGDFIKGKVYHNDELVLEGEFKNYILNGEGKKYLNGQVLQEGEFSNGILNGHGKKYENGILLEEGEFKEGILNGFGKKYVQGKLFEEGYFINGILNGEGKRYVDKYRREEGSFLNGKLNGKGKIFNGDNVFREGDFKDGALNGMGKVYIDGELYQEGEFKDNKLNGEGKWYYKRKLIQEGHFKEGKLHGIGKVYYDDGDLYEVGEFENGELVKSIKKVSQHICSNNCMGINGNIDSSSSTENIETCPYCGAPNIKTNTVENKDEKTTAAEMIKNPIKKLNGFINSKTGISGKDVVENGKRVVNMCIEKIKRSPRGTR